MDSKKFVKLRGNRGAPARLANSRAVVADMEPVAERILRAAKQDPNPVYADAVYKRVDRKRRDRARWIITLPNFLEPLAQRVEAKRGTMRRAVKAG